MNCKICGKDINKGSMCNDCKLKTMRLLKAEFSEKRRVGLEDLKGNPQMYNTALKHKRLSGG